MFCLAAVIPSPPILVPALCGGAVSAGAPDSGAGVSAAGSPEAAVVALRDAVLATGRVLAAAAAQWTVLGVGAAAQTCDSGTRGTFCGFGPDLPVSLGGPDEAGRRIDPELPLAVLIAGWLRGVVAPRAEARAQVVAAQSPVSGCAETGAKLRTELDATAEPQGVLVVADGAATLSTAAPGYFNPRAERAQDGVDRALAAGDAAGLLALDPVLCTDLMMSGRAAYQVLAGLFAGDPEPPLVTEQYRGAPFGVGYFAGVWQPHGVHR